MANMFDSIIDTLFGSAIKLAISLAVIGGIITAGIIADNTTLVAITTTLGTVPTWLGLFVIVAFGSMFVVMTNGGQGGRRRGRRKK